MAQEQGISVQSDTLAPVSGGPVRTILATVLINGVPTQVQMQVVALADERGIPFERPPAAALYDRKMLNVLYDIRALLCNFMGVSETAYQDETREGGVVLS